jgi:DNA-binding YbaB/EbfC family protein
MKRSGGGAGGAGGMQNLMRQANQMQLKIKKVQEELQTREYEGTAGGGAITVKVRGEHEVIAVKINEEVVKSGDAEMLQDLVLAAVNDALTRAHDTHAAEMQKATGGFNFPGL